MNARRAVLAALAAALMITSVAAAVPAAVADFEQSRDPVWSPDGRKIAFVGDGKIYVMNADGSGKRRLTPTRNAAPGFRPDSRPAWSPDGRKIAFQTLRHAGPGACSDGHPSADCNWEIYVMNADGSGQRRLTHSPGMDLDPTWSPDGRKIAFVSRRQRCPGVADDRLAYVCGNAEIYVMNADGTGQRNLTRNPARDGHPVWSPDGKTIGFVANRGGNRDIYVMSADGSRQRNLTADVPQQAFGIAWMPAQTR